MRTPKARANVVLPNSHRGQSFRGLPGRRAGRIVSALVAGLLVLSGQGFAVADETVPDEPTAQETVEPSGTDPTQSSETTVESEDPLVEPEAPAEEGEVPAEETDIPAEEAEGPAAETELPAEETAPEPRRAFIVLFNSGTSGDNEALLTEVDATETSSIPQLRMYSAELTDTAVAALRADASVFSVEVDKVREVEATPNDPSYDGQWALPQIGWDTVYGSVEPSGSATVAVLDTGVDATDDLAANLVGGASMLEGAPGTDDPNGHGTAMAGIVAASTGNATGIAGVGYAGVSVMPVKVLDESGLGQDSDIVEGVVWATENGADVILMSFSNPGYSYALQAAVDYAWANGVVLVAATGNDGSSTATYPAGTAKVVGVSATNREDGLWSGSNYGAAVFLGAPGVDIATGSGSVTGTSASAAIVAGSAALVAANDKSASNGVVVGRLARNTDPAGTAEETGNGRVNLARALADASTDPVVPQGVAGDGGPVVGPYVAATKKLTLTVVGSGSVTWSSTDGGSGSCNDLDLECEAVVDNLASVTLTATPATGTLTGAGCPGTGTCTIAMGNVHRSVTVTFPSCAVPSVVMHPAAQSVTYGVNAQFSATASGGPTPAVKWQLSTDGGSTWVDVEGATSTTLSLSKPAVARHGDRYRAVFSNSCGTATTNAATLSVAPKNLTVSGAVAQNKPYDKSDVASVRFGSATLVGVASGETVTLDSSWYAAKFEDANVGSHKPVTVTGVNLSGTSASNYTVSQPSGLTADITQLAVTGAFDANDKPYDGNTSATVTAGSRVLAGTVEGDQVSLSGGTARFDDKNVGTAKTVTLTGAGLAGDDSGNYTLTSVGTTTADITQLAVTGAFDANDKPYDGNTSATVTAGSRVLAGTVEGDQVSLSGGTARFDDKNVGTAKTVTLTGAGLAGDDSGNYTLTSVGTTTADITQLAVTGAFDANDKPYDGNTSATVTAGSRVLAGTVEGDQVSLSGGTARFDDKNVGTAKTVTLTGAGLAGDDSGNYTLTSVGTTTADITQLAVTGAFDANDKPYDGNTSATVTAGSRVLAGTVEGDQVSLSGGTARFDDKNVGTAKTVTLTGAGLAGDDSGNYTLTSVGTTTADITRKPLVISASSPEDIIVGSPAPIVTAHYAGFISGEGAGDLLTDPVCGTSYTESASVGSYETTCLGATAQNYSIETVDGSFDVVYGWTGFLQPINDTAHQTSTVQSRFKLGQTIPAKFVIRNALGDFVQQIGNPTLTVSSRLGNCEGTAELETVVQVAPTPGGEFKWDGSQYHYNWSTKSIKVTGVYRISAHLADGTTRSVEICLR